MIWQIDLPVTFLEAQTTHRKFNKAVKTALEELDDALNQGYAIVAEFPFTSTIGDHRSYILHKPDVKDDLTEVLES